MTFLSSFFFGTVQGSGPGTPLSTGVMLGLMLIYAVGLLVMARSAARRKHCALTATEADHFFVNGRAASASGVAMSIVASCVGGSATVGMAGLGWQAGLPAIWWLGSGAMGLAVLGVFLAKKIRQTGAVTMPAMVGAYLGPSLRPLISVIIVIAWISILAAQFSALAAIAGSMTGSGIGLGSGIEFGPQAMLLPCAVFIILYAALGGQATIMRGDATHLKFLVIVLLLGFGALLLKNGAVLSAVSLELVNSHFPMSRLSYFLLVMGGSYVVCPMLFGRLLSANSRQTARKGTLWAAAGLLAVAVLIVSMGILSRGLVPENTPPEQVLALVFHSQFPGWLSAVILLGLFSAVLSSADSCLITAATVLSSDILHRPDIRTCRWCLVLIGICGFVLASSGRGVLHLLLMANDIYVCGVVAPVFVGMLLHGKKQLSERTLTVAVCVGGALGLMAAVSGENLWAFAGVGASVLISLCAVRADVPTPFYPASGC